MSVASSFPKVYHRTAARNCKKLVIAVHGMGDQSRNDMVRCVSSLFAQVFATDEKISTQAIHLPQGLWEGEDSKDPVKDDMISYAPAAKHDTELQELADMAFAEIYWADIPREIEDAHRLEPSPQWAGSVVDRLRQRDDLLPSYSGSDVTTGATVLEEVAETVNIFSRVLIPLEKAGSFTFDLGRILNQYLGDVQQVADFKYVRDRLLDRFRARIDYLAEHSQAEEIHFVAHSEGTVLTLRTLLRAMNKREGESPVPCRWLDRVCSLTTLGSPIDKHLFLWPEMWGWLAEGEDEVSSTPKAAREPLLKERRSHWYQMPEGKKIRWRNYYDLADPVGYELDTVRNKLELWGCQNFEFTNADDFGFRRYPLAGMAHLGYFDDPVLFKHIYQSAILGKKNLKKPAGKFAGSLSPVIPFVIVAAIHLAAVVVLHHSMEKPQMQQVLDLLKGSSMDVSHMITWLRSWQGMLASGLVLSGTTFWSRAGVIDGWRFCKTFWSMAYYFATMGVLFWLSQAAGLQTELVARSIALPSLLLVALGRIIDRCSRSTGHSPLWALRWQMIAGGAALGLVTLLQAKDADAPLLTAVLGSVTFMYVWWLGVLLYDLCYVWKRYINTTGETFVKKLRNNVQKHYEQKQKTAQAS